MERRIVVIQIFQPPDGCGEMIVWSVDVSRHAAGYILANAGIPIQSIIFIPRNDVAIPVGISFHTARCVLSGESI